MIDALLNDETRMTNDESNPNDEIRMTKRIPQVLAWEESFGHSSFDFRI